MTQAITDARNALERMLEHPNNLLDIHSALATGPGRRWREKSLNHAAIFLIVAAWQAYVEETAEAIVGALTPPPAPPPAATAPAAAAPAAIPPGAIAAPAAGAPALAGAPAHAAGISAALVTYHFNLVKATFSSAKGRFNTPDSERTRDLFLILGFDPRPSWTWAERGATRPVADVVLELDRWLQVRHKIAHGDTLPALPIVTGGTRTAPTLRRKDVERCRRFFRKLADVTTAAANARFP